MWLELACLRCRERCEFGPTRADFRRTMRRIPGGEDCLAEGSEFELPVPILEVPLINAR